MTSNERISREDLEKRFAHLQEDFQGKLENKKQTVLVAAAVGSSVLVLLSYLLGRRRGTRRSTRVQFRQK
ncbi:MAG: hypothetical protein WCG49_00155 [Actinomycetes bacterium]|jgi:hypothetical protein